jgi:hypothetical protein
MRKLLITAAAGMAMIAAAGTANAMPGSTNGVAVDNPITNVALCFYLDGWNGPGMYDCGFRYNRGHGWHGKRHDGHHGGHHSGKHSSGKHSSGKHSGKKHH